MKIIKTEKIVKISDIIPNPNNIKEHTRRQIEILGEKISKYGFNQPVILDENNNLLVGHGRLKGAEYAGLDEVPCIIYENLTEEQKQEIMVYDNKSNESKWSVENILKIDPNILVLSGFTLNDIEKMKDLNFKGEEIEKFSLDKMELIGFEKYDYLVFVFDDETDILNAFQKFNVKKIEFSFSSSKKIGMGRIISGKKLLEKLK